MKQRIAGVVTGIQRITGQAVTAFALFMCLVYAGLSIHDASANLPLEALRKTKTGSLLIPNMRFGNKPGQDIFVVNADGTGLTALTNTPDDECYPTWSPDGTQIAFARCTGGHYVISIMDADGTNIRDLMVPELTRSIYDVENTPAWSPDGKHIAFTSSRDDNLEVYVMGIDGSNPRNLTTNPAGDAFPAWSPDGKEIAFTSDRDGTMHVYICNSEGDNIRQITSGEARCFAPSWAPDGQQLLFTTIESDDSMFLDLVDVNGIKMERLHTGLEKAWYGTWAGNGRYISYPTVGRQPPAIIVLDTETRACIPVASDNEEITKKRASMGSTSRYFRPQWSPDSARIVFSVSPVGGIEIQPGDVVPDFEPAKRRWVYLGKHGELFVPGENSVLNGNNELQIEPSKGGFALIHLGEKWSGTYAIINRDCTIEYVLPLPKGMDHLSAVQVWPYHDEKGSPIMPPYDAVIAAENAVLPDDTVAPEGMIGWIFLCADDGFYTPEQYLSVHANTLWVIRKADELHFIRTGPIAKGEVYATVKSNREVIFAPGIYDGPALCWGLVDEEGMPAFSRHERRWSFILPCDDDRGPGVIRPDGEISLPATLEY